MAARTLIVDEEISCPHDEYKLISLGKDDDDGRYIPVAIWKCVKCGHREEDIWDDESSVRMRWPS